MNKKFTSRILSMLLAMLMLVSMLPTSVFAAPASDIPAEMLDNVFLDALEYTGYRYRRRRMTERFSKSTAAARQPTSRRFPTD